MKINLYMLSSDVNTTCTPCSQKLSTIWQLNSFSSWISLFHNFSHFKRYCRLWYWKWLHKVHYYIKICLCDRRTWKTNSFFMHNLNVNQCHWLVFLLLKSISAWATCPTATAVWSSMLIFLSNIYEDSIYHIYLRYIFQ